MGINISIRNVGRMKYTRARKGSFTIGANLKGMVMATISAFSTPDTFRRTVLAAQFYMYAKPK